MDKNKHGVNQTVQQTETGLFLKMDGSEPKNPSNSLSKPNTGHSCIFLY